MKSFYRLLFVTLLIGLSSCFNSKTTTEVNTVNNYNINDLTGKWLINNSNDYIVFEDTTKRMVLKTSCGIIIGNFIKIDQALIFNQLKDYSENCLTSIQNLKQELSKITYYKINSPRSLTLYDESHNEKLTLLYNK